MSSRRIQAGFVTRIEYMLRGVVGDLWYKKAGTFLTVLAIAAALTIPTVSYLLFKNINQTATDVYPESQMTVYLNKTLSEDDANLVTNKIRSEDGIASLNYISRQQSLEDFRSWSGMDDELQALDDNPLPAVVIITLEKDINNDGVMSLRNTISKIKGVDEVRMDGEWVEKLSALVWLIGRITFWCALLMFVSVLLVIGSNIRSEVYSKRDSIEVAKVLGATDYFILRPFLYTGLIFGALGGILAIIFSSLLILYFASAIKYVADIFLVPFEMSGLNLIEMAFIIMVTAFIGWGAAGLAARKHINKLD